MLLNSPLEIELTTKCTLGCPACPRNNPGEKKEDWIEISDYESRKVLYFKIPQEETYSSYYNLVKQDLRSNNPYRRIEITKARVYAETD